MNTAFGGISLSGVEGIALFRQLYRRGGMALLGREQQAGRSLWKLESRPFSYSNGRKLGVAMHTRLIVLVDPKTFLPITESQIDIALPGHPAVVESNLLSYGRYAGTESEGRLFDLASQHPGARVRAVGPPEFRSLRGRGRGRAGGLR
jgi:hypothetical protein